MISIPEIVDLFSYYEDMTFCCPKCGHRPKFFYNDTCTTESVITLKCDDFQLTRTISLIQLSQSSVPKLYITSVLTEMVNTWNETVRRAHNEN